MVEFERFDISTVPEHGRPKIVEFRGDEGRLAVHCERDTGALWLFADGPRGGARGTVVFPVRMAERLLSWLEDGARNAAPSTQGVLWLDRADEGRRTVAVAADALRRARWRMALDEPATDELLSCLRAWATALREAVAE